MKFCDLHCDTPLELYNRQEMLQDSSLQISLDKAADIEKYVQCAAIWSDRRLSDEDCFETFLHASDYFSHTSDGLLCKTPADINNNRISFVLTVEDARLLCGKAERLKTLHNAGVRILTLLWKGETVIGGGWDTDCGLSAFGKQTVDACFDIGIIPDVSHASRRSLRDTAEIARMRGKPFIASHSNAYAICRCDRNLDAEGLSLVASSGGIVGVSLYPPHLTDKSGCTSDDVMRHISYYINACGGFSVAFGCDFDGIDKTPADITDLSGIPEFYERTADKIGTTAADRIFFENAYNFLLSNI